MTPAQQDARLGRLCAYAFDMFAAAPTVLNPQPDPRLASGFWAIRGYLTAHDVILRPLSWLELFAPQVCYGFLAQSVAYPDDFVAVIRGTADVHEWVLDAKFAQVDHPLGGNVEAGFYGVYRTLKYRAIGDSVAMSAADGISQAVGKATVHVVGHSLGAALATYLTLDLATASQVTGRFFASPRPGDQAFADAFASHVKDAVAYINPLDVVPEVPLGFGYLPLHCQFPITPQIAQAVIVGGPECQHHIYSYCALLDYDLMNWAAVPDIDKPLTACIRPLP